MKATKTKIFALLTAIVCLFTLLLTACGKTEEPVEKTVSKIEVVQQPYKLEYDEGEMLDLTGMKVDAVYSDKSREDVTAKCTTNLDGKALKVANTAFYVSYRYEENGKQKSKTAPVNITVVGETLIPPETTEKISITSDMLPKNVIKTSSAPMVFYTFYDSTSMNCDASLELTPTEGETNKGTFRFTEENGIASSEGIGMEVKLGQIDGEYVLEGDRMTLQSKTLKVSANTGKYDGATKEVATVVRQGDKIVGLNFGKMSGDEKFWGWSKSKASNFVEGLATRYDLTADTVYMELVENNTPASYMKSYYEIEKMELADEGAGVRTSYFVGQSFDPTGLAVVVDFIVPEGSVDTSSKYKNLRLDRGFSVSPAGPLTAEDTAITVEFDGKSVSLPIEVKEIPQEKTLMGLTVNQDVWNIKYLPWQEHRVEERIGELALEVKAQYTDGTETVLTDYTVEESEEIIGGDLTSITVSYEENGVEQQKALSVSASVYTPSEYARVAQGDYVFLSSYLQSSNKINVVFVLTDGAYEIYCAQSNLNKIARLTGSYTVEGDVFTFLAEGATSTLLTGSACGAITSFESADRTATVLRDGDGKVVGLYNAVHGNFFGTNWTTFAENMATSYTDSEGEAYAENVAYLAIVENGSIPDAFHDYFAE